MKIRVRRPEFVPVIVGTGGHVDHGKTSLVRNLTGCETDRLPQEKERGLSIDLGFAPCLLPGNRMVSLVDVPGHEDFIRNMVAGAASIDVMMLVVAADDGVMPQTDEHLRIVKLLRTPEVMAVITKSDLVTADRLDLARQEISGFLSRMGFPDAPVIPASNVSGEGLDLVRDALDRLVEKTMQRPQDPRAFRMNVERVFFVEGHGTVATGMPLSGRVSLDETLDLLPGGEQTSVRAIQAFKFDADAAGAHTCAALNLRNIPREKIRRGMTLGAPGIYRPVTTALTSFRNVSVGSPLRNGQEIHFHAGTSQVSAKVLLVGAREVPPGQEGFGLVRLSEPIVLAAGDRYIARSLTPPATLGGGAVLSVRAERVRGRSSPALADRLRFALSAAEKGDVLGSEILAGTGGILDGQELARLTQFPPERARGAMEAKEKTGEIVDLGAGAWLVASQVVEAAKEVRGALTAFHEKHPFEWGMPPSSVCELLGIGVGNFQRLAEQLCRDGSMAVRHGRLGLSGFSPASGQRQTHLREEILSCIAKGGVHAPARGTLLAQMNMEAPELDRLVRLLIDEGRVREVAGNLMATEVFEGCRQKLLELFAASPVVDLNGFRRETGLSRNLSVAMLRMFDAEGMTHMVTDNGRALRDEWSAHGRS